MLNQMKFTLVLHSRNLLLICLITLNFSNSDKLQGMVQDKSWAGYPLKGTAINVQERSSSAIQKLTQKIKDRYQDLSGEVLDATTIGSLKNWPMENQESK
jgi:hypothetical protein